MMQSERALDIAGLSTTAVGDEDAPTVVVLLHGYAMQPADLAPFTHALGVPALFLLPRGPFPAPVRGHAWWEIDLEAKASALEAGPRDLAEAHPPGLDTTRARLEDFLDEVAALFRPEATIVAGFSQGGMLTLDLALRGSAPPVAGLAVMSASRIAFSKWQPRSERVQNLPVFLCHGRADADLAFSAGEALRGFLTAAGADVTWMPFDGAHEIPFVVWRSLRKFLQGLVRFPP